MSYIPTDSTELPTELVAKPLALIGITGLDTINNAIHKSIWEVFGNNHRPDRAPINFNLLKNDYKFPVIKPKRNSYDWYKPKGIIKKNWLKKHLELIPSVIVVFYDMDWNDSQWNEKIIECASRVQSMRAVTSMHSPKIVVVVIQNIAPLPSSEDIVGNEKAQALCAACEIQSKSLFVLPYGDHLMGYAIRLENAFYDLAQQYYHNEIRNIKSHRDHLNKQTHQYLFVRHQFKIGFINELKQDFGTAQKHYLNAYNILMEVQIIESNTLEIKTIAGFLNYKLCKLFFQLKQPKDAISQLRLHIERYCNNVGIRELAFEHHAWMSRQYRIFGDLFNEAVRNGLSVNQTKHPGFYYQQAAQCATERREACQRLCAENIAYPQPDPLQGMVEYYGQHIWKPGKMSNDVHDVQRERDAIRALQYNELHNGNHSMIIIKLLECAMTQFKTYRCPRMKRHLLVQMAREYYTCGDYGHSLTLLTRILYDYRKEKWWFIVSSILNEALICSFLTANIDEYVKLSIEALGKFIEFHDDKNIIIKNLNAVLNNEVPVAHRNIPESLVQNAVEKWESVINNESMNIVVDMSTLTSCIEAKARFTETNYQVDNTVTIEIFIKITAPAPIQIDQVAIQVNNSEFVVCEFESTPSLNFCDNVTRKFVHVFTPETQDVGRNLQINSISLLMGKSSGRRVILKYNGAGGNIADLYPEVFQYKHTSEEIPNFNSIQPLASAQIIARKSKMSVIIQQNDPALIGEWFPIVINLTNDESTEAHHLKLSLKLMSLDSHNTDTSAELCFDIENETSHLPYLTWDKDSLPSQSMVKKTFYLRSTKVLSTSILMKITYDITLQSDKKKMACFKEHSIKITVVKPFEVSSKYFTSRFREIDNCYNDEPFIAMPILKMLSPWPLFIENTEFEVSQHFKKINEDGKSCLQGLVVEENVITNEAICLKSTSDIENQPFNLGLYTIHWKRRSSDLNYLSKTSTMLAAPRVIQSWLNIEVNLPAHGYLKRPLPFRIKFFSTAVSPHSLLLRIEASDAFMYAGLKQCVISLLSDSMLEMVFNFHPLSCGLVATPRFHLSHIEQFSSDNPNQQCNATLEYFQELIDRNIPNQIFVMPQEQTDTSIDKKALQPKLSLEC